MLLEAEGIVQLSNCVFSVVMWCVQYMSCAVLPRGGCLISYVQFIAVTDMAGAVFIYVVYFTLTWRHLCAQHLRQ